MIRPLRLPIGLRGMDLNAPPQRTTDKAAAGL